jgi:MAP/microtubule affinity-regulating kinase
MICHRDIKPENIMFDPETGQVKIIDFGFACSSKEKLRVFCGTPSYMSPEIVSNRDYWGNAADVWACGVILFLLLTGTLPFKSGSEKELFRKIQKGVYVLARK